MQIRVDEVVKAKSGKGWAVKSGDKWYAARFGTGIETAKGRTIDAETETFGKDGIAIKSFKLVDLGPATPLPSASQMTSAPYWLAFASNTVNAAIAKGIITEPIQLKQWVFACKAAAEAAVGGDVGV